MDRALQLFLAAALVLSFSVTNRTNAQDPEKAAVISGPRPDYPYEARRARITGSGAYILIVDTGTGLVTRVEIAQSAGYKILDDAAVSAFRQWRFKPGGVSKVRLPVTYSMAGAVSFDPNRSYPFTGTVKAVNIPAHYFTLQGPRGSDVILISNATKLTKNSVPAGLGQVSVGDEVHGFAKITHERVAVATSVLFKSLPKH